MGGCGTTGTYFPKKYEKIGAVFSGPTLEESFKRVEALLSQAKDLDLIIMSGKGQADKMAEYAQQRKFQGAIIGEVDAKDTYENVINLKRIVNGLNAEEVYVSTSHYHIPSVSLVLKKYIKNRKVKKIKASPSLNLKQLLKRVAVEFLSIPQDIIFLYLCNGRKDIYKKTIKKFNKLGRKFI